MKGPRPADLHHDVAAKRRGELIVGVLRGVQEHRVNGASGPFNPFQIEVHRFHFLSQLGHVGGTAPRDQR